MAEKQRREKGTGTIYANNNGFSGKIFLGKDSEGKRLYKYFSGKTEAEVKRKIREYLKSGSEAEKKTITLAEYIDNWMKVYKLGNIKGTSYDSIDCTFRNYVKERIGLIQLQKVKDRDVKNLMMELQDEGFSYSTIKKVYNLLNAVFKHATIKKDVSENPMLEIKMLDENLFEKKEIRFFNKQECARIIEESLQEYRTGRRVYIYGDVFILILNTGLRIGEVVGLKKTDWDQDSKILHIRRNIQPVRNRDKEGNVLTGSTLVENTTKTYSGTRPMPLNKLATEALERLCKAYPESEYIVCSTKGTMTPKERIERTFAYLLKNIGIERCGLHSLRHTFASMLFAKKIDIKRISTLMGHANVQITINTYIHLFEEIDHNSVAILEDVY